MTVGAGKDWGLSLATPVIVKYRDDKTDTETELERWIREPWVPLARTLIDIDSTHRSRGRLRALVGRVPACVTLGWTVDEQAVADDRATVIALFHPPSGGVFDPLRLRAAFCDQPRRGRRAARAWVL